MKEEFLTEKERKMFARWRNESLLDMEKKRMRGALQEYVRHTSEKTVLKSSILLWPLFSYRASAFVLLLVAVIGSGWGIAKASEQSLPGEPLYAFKTEWSEPVRAAFHLSSEAKRSWQEGRIEARLDEAKRLAARKKLSDEDIETIETLLAKHQASLAQYSERDDTDGSEDWSGNVRIEIDYDGTVRSRGRESRKNTEEHASDEKNEQGVFTESKKDEDESEAVDTDIDVEDGERVEIGSAPKKKSSHEKSMKKSGVDSKQSDKNESVEEENDKEKESETDSSEEGSAADDDDADDTSDDDEEEDDESGDEEDIDD